MNNESEAWTTIHVNRRRYKGGGVSRAVAGDRAHAGGIRLYGMTGEDEAKQVHWRSSSGRDNLNSI